MAASAANCYKQWPEPSREDTTLSDQRILGQLAAMSRRAARLGYAAAGEGNTSARSSSGQAFWIKRSGCSLEDISSRDFIRIDIGGAMGNLDRAREAVLYAADPKYRASIEVGMHASIYAHQPEANFIVHTHPPCALSGCCVEDVKGFFVPQFPDSVVYLGVPEKNWVFLDYAPPGPHIARLLTAALVPLSADLRVVVLAKHGVITVGHTAQEAMGRTELLEKASYVRLMSLTAGRATSLTGKDIDHLEGMESEKYRQRVLKGQV
mgnify:CR=1 FL=1